MAEKERDPDDTYARQSFTFRRMTRAQLWAITIFVVILLAGAVVYALV
jgi:hypothetical protein